MHLEFAESFNLTCDLEALQEILSNLIRNASQAGANKLWIHAYRDHSAITIDVKDSGGGIPDSIAQRIFDPFFTTKDRKDGAESAGTGMGLFIVRESMRAMGGDIELMSKVKQGTTFRLLFRGFPKTERGVS
jgi:signal transduction histidine kinase